MARRARRTIDQIAAFWDSSALVPLCVYESATRSAIAHFRRYRLVVWWATPVEISSALARLARMQSIGPGERAQAAKLARDLADSWSVIQPSSPLRQMAIRLLERYDLRAADSLQLAAALEWCEGAPQGRVFLTADQRLHQAAALAGFDSKRL